MKSDRLRQLFAFLEKDPRDAFTLYSIAYEYMQQEIYEQAVEYFLKLKEMHPGYTGTYYHLGQCMERIGRKNEAEEIYRAGMKISREEGEMHTFSELQGVLNRLLGLDFEDDV